MRNDSDIEKELGPITVGSADAWIRAELEREREEKRKGDDRMTALSMLGACSVEDARSIACGSDTIPLYLVHVFEPSGDAVRLFLEMAKERGELSDSDVLDAIESW